MELVCRSQDARRFSDRRQNQEMSPILERRFLERRESLERRKTMEQRTNSFERNASAMTQSSSIAFDPQKKSIWASIPLWAPLSIFVLAFLIMVTSGNNVQKNSFSFAPPLINLPETSSAAPVNAATEVMVYDPSEEDMLKITGSGYEILDTITLKDLGLTVKHLRAPQGMTVPQALSDLRSRFPELEVDANNQVGITDPS